MTTNIADYTQHEIELALAGANIDSAIELWRQKDWTTYNEVRKVLLSVIRSGDRNQVGIPQLQFIFFINTHLSPYFSERTPDQRMFLLDLSRKRRFCIRHWNAASEGEFWSAVI